MSKKILIVGGVAGGASCAARLRRLEEDAQIVLLERGDYVSYANCGLPYHIGDVIKSRDALLLLTPESMAEKYHLDVRVRSEAVAVDRARKTVTVKRTETGETYEESYDTLVLSTGSSPVRPPIPGVESDRVMTLWTVPDADRIRSTIRQRSVKRAVVVGGGFIGLEMAENLRHAGVQVTIVEMLPQVMDPLDYEMAQLLHENLERNGVTLCLGDGVSSFSDQEDGIAITLKSGKRLSADLAILSIGTRPNSELAKAAGLTVNERGGVVTDGFLRTSDPDIYAVGDVIGVEHFIDRSPAMIPLAGPANKQGRIAADNISGGSERYEGTQGTSIAKVFDLTAATTGLNEKNLIKRGLVRGIDFESALITQNSHAGYYPGALPLTLKLLYSTDGKKLFGAQIVGYEGVDKRMDVIAAVIRLGGGIHALKTLELAYAPPYSSAKDPVNMAGFTAENILSGRVTFSSWDAVEHNGGNTVLLDVREDAELMAYTLPGAVHIPLGQLRSRIQELDREKEFLLFCSIGVRSYTASRILTGNGFRHVAVYPGGTMFYRSTHYQAYEPDAAGTVTVSDGGHPQPQNPPAAAMRLDCSGLQCPGPIMKVFENMKDLQDGQVLEVSASDPGFVQDIAAWCRRTGNTLLSGQRRGRDYVALLQKGTAQSEEAALSPAHNGKTIVVFSGDLDKVLASFIIANGAAAMGRPVTMFFTFWGLNVLRRPEKQRLKKSLAEGMFGGMMPRGAGKLRLSNMHMAGLGTAMMKRVMGDKKIDSLEDLIKKALKAGVKLVACTMSMDVMGIRKEELIDGVELGGVGAYLGDAEESNVNLFI